jgi:hypothetical protein
VDGGDCSHNHEDTRAAAATGGFARGALAAAVTR